MTTLLQSFNIAMALADTVTDNADYLTRVVDVANNLMPELYQISDTKVITSGSRPVPALLTVTSDLLPIDDALARQVLPSGLIARMFATDDAALANYHQQLYQEGLAKFRNVPVEAEAIDDIYSITDGSDYTDE